VPRTGRNLKNVEADPRDLRNAAIATLSALTRDAQRELRRLQSTLGLRVTVANARATTTIRTRIGAGSFINALIPRNPRAASPVYFIFIPAVTSGEDLWQQMSTPIVGISTTTPHVASTASELRARTSTNGTASALTGARTSANPIARPIPVVASHSEFVWESSVKIDSIHQPPVIHCQQNLLSTNLLDTSKKYLVEGSNHYFHTVVLNVGTFAHKSSFEQVPCPPSNKDERESFLHSLLKVVDSRRQDYCLQNRMSLNTHTNSSDGCVTLTICTDNIYFDSRSA